MREKPQWLYLLSDGDALLLLNNALRKSEAAIA